jgi:hypothetical protein
MLGKLQHQRLRFYIINLLKEVNQNMNSISKKTTQVKDFFFDLGNDLHREQKEFFFHKKSQEEETEYFDFFKFLFQSPDKTAGF